MSRAYSREEERKVDALLLFRPDKGFCGSIGLWPVTQKKVAKAKSVYHKKGDVYDESVTMDGKIFIEMMKEIVFPTAVAKVGMWAEKIIFQMDSAGSVLSFSIFFLVSISQVFVEFPPIACDCPSFSVDHRPSFHHRHFSLCLSAPVQVEIGVIS